ncbi:MAG: DICT sensory domain-containing protein [Jaaginema sp. PMC 1079.18]|nr:DICT sensory domain-containing protein [Jaaginema sp. PMC 1080.18]MEC4850295.1 DICT sensory domain-containing protein [Jaaginema sp. PMC 1079.18]MEC4865865.1 DICT sensory domain-containing protein [Jaaginema sp. PMC 1078.18]
MLPGSILQKLYSAHQSSDKPLNLGVYYKNTLVALCHALEDFILESHQPPLVIAAFQQGKWYAQEAERYTQLAAKSRQITIMAMADTGFADVSHAADNTELVSLKPDDPVTQEWHLIVLSPTYTAMVLCQELTEEDYGDSGQPERDLERKFYGFWTFEPKLVQETIELAIAHLGQYNSELQQKLQNQADEIAAEAATDEYQRDDLSSVVLKVVDYLKNTQQDINSADDTGMFGSQALDDNLMSNEMQAFLRMAQLIDQADVNNPMAAAEVASLAEAMGQLLDLPAWQIKRLRLAGLLHRLAPLQGASQLSNPRSEHQQKVLEQKGLLPKASVLRIMPQMDAIANIIIHQWEYWDGSGKPEGLAYDNIPLESRILSLVAEFQQQVVLANTETQENPLSRAFDICQAQVGTRFDPKLIEALSLLVMGIQQGMSLQANQPKIASGIWLLETPNNEVVKLIGI